MFQKLLLKYTVIQETVHTIEYTRGFNGAVPCPRAPPVGALMACRAGWNGPCGKAKCHSGGLVT